MAKIRNVAQEVPENDLIQKMTEAPNSDIPIEEMPLENIRDYRLYNEAARKANKKLRLCRYPIKPCPVELHPKQRIKFMRKDQPTNPLPVFISNDLIHFDQTLFPGKVYDLPECIVHYLSEKGNPIWAWVDLPDGSKETRVVNKDPRFALQTIYQAG